MARSSRPELIKDNPPAPQVYVRWRKKRNSLHLIKRGGGDRSLHEALRRVMEAAEAYVDAAPQSKRAAVERQALTEAIVQAQRLLSRE